MHSQPTVAKVMALRQEGLGARRIAKLTDLPIATVRDWLAGRLPRHSRGGLDAWIGAPTCEECGQGAHDFAALPPDYVYLLGLYLGDGSIATHARGVFRLRITLDTAYPGIIESAAAAIRQVNGGHVSAKQRTHQNCVDVSSYWKAWPCLLPQHGPGKKHDRVIRLEEWQRVLVERHPEQLLRGLIQSDGHRFINTGRNKWTCPRYGFDQVSDDIRAIFCDACDLLGLRWTRSGKRTIYISRKADVALLDEFIGPKR